MNFSSSPSGDRPYEVDTCEKEFNYLTTYKRHLNLHKGEKPFACEHCNKKFTRLNYLKNHLNTHAKHASQDNKIEPDKVEGDGGTDANKDDEVSSNLLVW